MENIDVSARWKGVVKEEGGKQLVMGEWEVSVVKEEGGKHLVMEEWEVTPVDCHEALYNLSWFNLGLCCMITPRWYRIGHSLLLEEWAYFESAWSTEELKRFRSECIHLAQRFGGSSLLAQGHASHVVSFRADGADMFARASNVCVSEL